MNDATPEQQRKIAAWRKDYPGPRALPQPGYLRNSFVAKMSPIAWMLWNDPALFAELFGTAMTYLRLGQMHQWADAIEQESAEPCSLCKQLRWVEAYTVEGEGLCLACFESVPRE